MKYRKIRGDTMSKKIIVTAVISVFVILILLGGWGVHKFNIVPVSNRASDTRDIPVLMYHSIDDTKGPYSVTAEKFKSDMDGLLKAGYTPVSYDEVVSFVHGDGSLPKKPVLITFDDGYKNNYEVVYPIVKEKNIKTGIFTIGSFIEYGDNAFTLDMAKEMEKSGLVGIGSHTYDLHRFDKKKRIGVTRMKTESVRQWEYLLRNDLATVINLTKKTVGKAPVAFAYPYGYFNAECEAVIRDMGYLLTVTSEPGIGSVTKGDKESSYLLPRICMDGKEASAAQEIENHRKTGKSVKIAECKKNLVSGAYATRIDALNKLYENSSKKANIRTLKKFVDVNHLSEEEKRIMALAVNDGIIHGIGEDILGAEYFVTRGEFAVMLSRKTGMEETTEIKHTFTDGNEWNEKALSLCCEKGYMKPKAGDTFGCEDILTMKELNEICSKIKE